MIHQLASRPWLNKALSGLSVLLAVVGVGMLAYPFTTNLYQCRLQNRLDGELASEGLREKYEAGRLGEGDALTRLQIPATGVDVVLRDERYTSRMAESALLESGMKRRKRRESVDKVAAAIILQDYLDSNR